MGIRGRGANVKTAFEKDECTNRNAEFQCAGSGFPAS